VAVSDLGGIQELLEGVEGCVRLPLEVGAWRELLARLLRDPASLVLQPPPPRGFDAIAHELMPVYQETP